LPVCRFDSSENGANLISSTETEDKADETEKEDEPEPEEDDHSNDMRDEL
jgi:hypothetical protein